MIARFTKHPERWPLPALALIVLLGAATLTNAQQDSMTAAEARELASFGKDFVEVLDRRDFAKAEPLFDTAVKKALPEAKLKKTWDDLLKESGPFGKVTGYRVERFLSKRIVLVRCEFQNGPLDAKIVYSAQKKITGLWFVPTAVGSEYRSLADLDTSQSFGDLQTRIYVIREETGPETKALVEAILRANKTPSDPEGHVTLVEGTKLIVRASADRFRMIEEMLASGCIIHVDNNWMTVASFNLTPRERFAKDSASAQDLGKRIVEVVEEMLYGKEGKAKAYEQGRRLWYDPATFQLTITDYPDRIKLVSDYLASLPQLEQRGTGAPAETHEQTAGKPDLKATADQLTHTVIAPHLEEKITSGTNVLWCDTFQLAWNEFCDLAGGPIQMDSPPAMVAILNKRTASKEDLDQASYVAMAGLAEKGIFERIRSELGRKFGGLENPDLLNSVPQDGFVAYAYLFKELPFQWAFTRFHDYLTFAGYRVDAFGIHQYSVKEENEAKMATQVAVVDYKGRGNLIVELKTKANDDRLILAMVPPEASLGETIAMVRQRVLKATPTQMKEMTTLEIPVLNFDLFKTYSQLHGRSIHSANKEVDGGKIALAAQTVRFRLDERGAVLKSEAIVWGGIGEQLIFDKPFLILLERRDARNPYFALWVGNAELLVPVEKKPVKR